MNSGLRDESGFSVIEVLIAMFLMGILLAGLGNLFISGSRAGADSSARVAAQGSTTVGLGRLEFETRCASQATILSSGGGVALTLPSWCSHATGSTSWCIVGGMLTRYTTLDCTGSAQRFASGVTTATPFSCVAPVGPLPKLQVSMTVNTTGRTSDAVVVLDTIAMRNASPTTSTTTNCS